MRKIQLILLSFIFLFSISFVSAEINITSCPILIQNVSNEVYNVQNDLSYGLNQICFDIKNVSNIVINGNNYSVNSTVTTTGVSTFAVFNDLVGLPNSNITFNDFKITGGNGRMFYLVSNQRLDGLYLNNINWNSTSIVSSTYFIQIPASTSGVNNLNINGLYYRQNNYGSVAIQGILQLGSSAISVSNVTFNNVDVEMVNPMAQFGGSNNATTVFDNFNLLNSKIKSFGNGNLLSIGYDNVNIINTTLSFNGTVSEQQQGVLLFVNQPLKSGRKYLIANSTFNSVILNYNSPSYPITDLCLQSNNFNNSYLNSTNGIKSNSQFVYINTSCSYNNIGVFAPSNITYVDFYYPVDNDNYVLKYLSGYYPNNVYKYMIYNDSNGGYYYNDTTLVFDENLTYYPNNNFVYPTILGCTENWEASLGECISGEQLLYYTDINNCGTTNNLPSNNNTFVPCNNQITGDFTASITPIASIMLILVVIVIICGVLFLIYQNFKK